MKEATGELNMTLVTVIAVAAILVFVTTFVPRILENVSNRWSAAEGTDNTSERAGQIGGQTGTNGRNNP